MNLNFLEIGVSPQNILAIYLIGNIILMAVLMVFQVRSGQKRNIALNATFLVCWLDVFSFVTGFSIGWLISVVKIFVGVLFLSLVKYFRLPIAVTTCVGLLLALSLRGFFGPAVYILYILLIGGGVAGIIGMIRFRINSGGDKFELSALGFVVCLAGLSFFPIPTLPYFSRSIPISATFLGLLFAIILKNTRQILWKSRLPAC